jgi:hypothetical protein
MYINVFADVIGNSTVSMTNGKVQISGVGVGEEDSEQAIVIIQEEQQLETTDADPTFTTTIITQV